MSTKRSQELRGDRGEMQQMNQNGPKELRGDRFLFLTHLLHVRESERARESESERAWEGIEGSGEVAGCRPRWWPELGGRRVFVDAPLRSRRLQGCRLVAGTRGGGREGVGCSSSSQVVCCSSRSFHSEVACEA